MKGSTIKQQFAHALVELCERKPLNKITVADLLQHTELSRYLFYKYFRDLNDLIVFAYHDFIVDHAWIGLTDTPTREEFYLGCLSSATRMLKYRKFFIAAFKLDGQNSLRDYVLNLYEETECKMISASFGLSASEADVRLYLKYRAYGEYYLRYHWLIDEPSVPPEQIAKQSTDTRYALLALLLKKDGIEKW